MTTTNATPSAPVRPHYPPGTSALPPRLVGRAAPPAGFPLAATPYERLPRTLATYTWWRLVLAGLIAGGVWLVGQVILVLPLLWGSLGDPFALEDRLLNLDALDVPVLLVALGSLAILIPGLWFGMWVMRLRPAWILSSVAVRLRWRWLVRCGLYSIVTLAVSLGAGIGIGTLAGEASDVPVWTPLNQLLLPLLVIFALVPFQAAAEEYLFRGFMVQALGSWLPQRVWSRVVIVLVTTGLFVSGHAYELWGLLDVGVFALGALWVTLRTGGLEAAIALHVVNNLVAFTYLASGATGSTQQSAAGGSLIGVIITAITTIGYCIAVEFTARRWGLVTTSPWPQVGSTRGVEVPLPVPGAGGAGWTTEGSGAVVGALQYPAPGEPGERGEPRGPNDPPQ